MKKIFLLAFITSTFFYSCKKESDLPGNAFELEVAINKIPDGVRAFLKVPNQKGNPISKDTAIVQNGKFIFDGNANYPEMAFIYINGAEGNIPVILEKGRISINAFKDSLATSVIKGGKHNESHNEFINTSKSLAKQIKEVRRRYGSLVQNKDTAQINKIRKEINVLTEKGNNYQMDYIHQNPDTYISVVLMQRLLMTRKITPRQAEIYYNKLSDDLKKTRSAREMHAKMTEMARTSIGAVAPNFSAPNPEGKQIALNDIKGKVTIIDFWASWCGPCRKENPNVVNVYNKFHDQGLEIIGVSLDGKGRSRDPKGAWIKAIKDDGLPWHHISNLADFRDPIAQTYNVKAIPSTFILDENGIIVAKNLRGQRLEEKIEELLSE